MHGDLTKMERVKTVMCGETPDVTPAGFWFHYPSSYTVDQMVEAHLTLYRKTDMDIIKIMQDYPYPIMGKIQKPEDWYNITVEGTDSPAFAKMAEIIRRIKEETNGEVLIFQTMFGPFKAASMAFGDDVLMEHSRTNPQAVKAGVQIIADALTQWAQGYLDAGADGIYYSAQFGEVGRFTRTAWENLVMPFDLQVLGAAGNRQACYNILHICGEPEYQFQVHLDRYGAYPADLFNWSVKDNHYSLERGRDFYRGGILGGLNNKGNILNGTDEDIRAEVDAVVGGFGRQGLMIGADCTIQGENISLDKIKTAVDAAHSHRA